jgi:hypothetical protein
LIGVLCRTWKRYARGVEIKEFLNRHRFDESELPVKVEFLVKRAVLQDGTVFNAEGLSKALWSFYK